MRTTTISETLPERGPRSRRGPRGRSLIAIVPAAVLAFGACGGNPAGQDRALGILRSAGAAMDGVTSYHTEGSVVARTAQGEVRVVVSSDVERPDRVRSTTDVSGLVVQSISVAGRTWVKDAVGPWRDLKPGSKDAAAGDPFALLRGLDDARVAGSETVGGTEAWLIETSASAGAVVRAFPAGGAPAPSGTAKVSVWIAKSGSRVLRILATTPGGGFTVDVSFSKFGEKFGIVPPKG